MTTDTLVESALLSITNGNSRTAAHLIARLWHHDARDVAEALTELLAADAGCNPHRSHRIVAL